MHPGPRGSRCRALHCDCCWRVPKLIVFIRQIAEWGGVFGSGTFSFADFNLSQLTATIPKAVPSGDYLVRIEQIGLHVTGGFVSIPTSHSVTNGSM